MGYKYLEKYLKNTIIILTYTFTDVLLTYADISALYLCSYVFATQEIEWFLIK